MAFRKRTSRRSTGSYGRSGRSYAPRRKRSSGGVRSRSSYAGKRRPYSGARGGQTLRLIIEQPPAAIGRDPRLFSPDGSVPPGGDAPGFVRAKF